ncbi:MAG: hypothetical protein LIP16_10250 [Clostridium sp.]|nr:hypothetical protein [Clostridium sp.]
MSDENMETLLKHIKEGRYIPDTIFDIRRMLAYKDMELYAKPCCDRIVSAGLVDGIHIARDIESPWNLVADVHGMDLCREILKSYLQPEDVDDFYDVAKWCHELVILNNNQIYSLRKMTTKDIKASQKDLIGCTNGDDKEVAELLRAELESRRLPCRMHHLAGRIGFTCRLLAMFRGPMRALVPVIKKSWKGWERNGSEYYARSSGKYAEALRRFTNVHGGTAGACKLRGDDLIWYIYLAVKVYGKENQAEFNHAKAYKSCLEIENRYQKLKQVMDTIGRLTPMELLRLYPVDKEYDGKKWGTKDYFYTMDRLRRLPADKPIGDAQDVAVLLWDYQNWDLAFLLLQWENVLGDLHVYCNEPGPQDELHDRMKRAV